MGMINLSYSSRSITQPGGTVDDFTTKLQIKHVRYNGSKALAFYFHGIKEVESDNEQCGIQLRQMRSYSLNDSKIESQSIDECSSKLG